jgi:hypothetical protein
VVDDETKLQNTLCHEMCHVAAWLINHVSKPPHGPMFKRWAAQAMSKYRHLSIQTCHSYKINYKFTYVCMNEDCGAEYGRHSKSIDTEKSGCGRCRGRLKLQPRLKVDGTPAKPRAASGFSLYVKAHYARVKAANSRLNQAEIMRVLGAEYKGKQKQPSATMMVGADGDEDDAADQLAQKLASMLDMAEAEGY